MCTAWRQHDIVWEALTARQHLRFYARLKNTPPEQVDHAIMRGLRQVTPPHHTRGPSIGHPSLTHAAQAQAPYHTRGPTKGASPPAGSLSPVP